MSEAPAAHVPEAGWPERWLQATLAYRPRSPALFRAALTHRSAAGPNNERLEFLGDAVLNLLVARRLYDLYPEADEGDLSRLRARLVSTPPLAQLALQIRLGDELLLGGGELKTGGFRRESILADALEALIGALYLDGGLPAVEPVLHAWFAPLIAALPDPRELKDPKTRLQELLQGRGLPLPDYQLVAVTGEPHAQSFAVRATVTLPAGARGLAFERSAAARELNGEGAGTSRRRAEQCAAQALLDQLGEGHA
jgi:ribonuclease-3